MNPLITELRFSPLTLVDSFYLHITFDNEFIHEKQKHLMKWVQLNPLEPCRSAAGGKSGTRWNNRGVYKVAQISLP